MVKKQSKKSCKRINGTVVPARCIIKRSSVAPPGMTRAAVNKAIMKRKEKVSKKLERQYGVKKCSKGNIMKKGYIRKASKKNKNKRSVKVAPTCISAKPGKKSSSSTARIGPLMPDVLKKYGYKASLTKDKRQGALNKALKVLEPVSLFRRLTALRVFTKNKNPVLSLKFKNDAEYIKTTPIWQKRNTPEVLKRLALSRKSKEVKKFITGK